MSNTVDKLNQLLADSNVLFAKIHNYHWNIKGSQFFGIHSKTEELYEYLATMYDDLAERSLQLGGKPIVTLKKILEVSKIAEEEKTDFDAKYVIQNILKDLEYLVEAFKEISSCEKTDAVTVAFADDKCAYFEKQIWMLKAFIS
ncbi:MAG: DNA starvation/stationary phase protection protein [Alphaproteobacteria bacterium]